MRKKDIFIVIIIYMIFPISSILMKYAAISDSSFTTFILFSSSILTLAIFSFFYQKLLKRSNLSVIYIFKSTTIIWTIIYGRILFGEEITLQNIIGVLLVICGVVICACEMIGEEQKK